MIYRYLMMVLVFFLLLGCSIPDDLGMPSWETEYRLNVLSDFYTADDIAEENEHLVAVEDSLRFQKSFEKSKTLGPIELVDTDEKSTAISLGEVMPPEYYDLHGTSGIIPDFTIENTEKTFDDIETFEQVIFHSGTFNLTITNNSAIWGGNAIDGEPMKVDVINNYTEEVLRTVIFEDPADPEFGDIPPVNGTETKVFDLAGKTYPTSIRLHLYGGSRGTDGATSFIDTTATIDFDMTITNIEADHIIGATVEEQPIDPIISTEEFDIPEPEIIGDFELTGSSIIKFEFSTLPIYSEMEVEIKGRNEDNEELDLIRYDGDPVMIFLPADLEDRTVIFHSDYYNINELVSILPEEFDVNLYPLVGDGAYVDTLSSSDSLYAEISLKTDFQIQSDGMYLIPKEDDQIKTTSSNVEDFNSDIYDSYLSGTVLLKYLNPSGMNIALDLFVSDSAAYVREEVLELTAPDTTKVQKFQIASMDTTSIEYKEFAIDIDQNDLDFFLADSVFWTPRFFIESSGDVPWTQGVGLKGELQLKIRIDEDLVDNLGD